MLKFQLFLSETLPVTPPFPCSGFICLVYLPLARPPCLQLGMKGHCSVSHSSLQFAPIRFPLGVWTEKRDPCLGMAANPLPWAPQEWGVDSGGE